MEWLKLNTPLNAIKKPYEVGARGRAKRLNEWASELMCKPTEIAFVTFHKGTFKGKRNQNIGSLENSFNAKFNELIRQEYEDKVFFYQKDKCRRFLDKYKGFDADEFYSQALNHFRYIIQPAQLLYLESPDFKEQELPDLSLKEPLSIPVETLVDITSDALKTEIALHQISIFTTDDDGQNGKFKKLIDVMFKNSADSHLPNWDIKSNYPTILLYCRIESGRPRIIRINLEKWEYNLFYHREHNIALAQMNEMVENGKKQSVWAHDDRITGKAKS